MSCGNDRNSSVLPLGGGVAVCCTESSQARGDHVDGQQVSKPQDRESDAASRHWVNTHGKDEGRCHRREDCQNTSGRYAFHSAPTLPVSPEVLPGTEGGS
jgi:hypothetical protein